VRENDYSSITESPGLGASAEQLSALYTRYRFAAEHVADRDVLEVACGTGTGLGYLAQTARRVVGGDIESQNLRVARKTYRGTPSIALQQFDAGRLPFADDSFDVVLLFEAIYYLPDVKRFLQETRRILRPGGKLILSTVQPEWDGFNPSPFSTHYFTATELEELMTQQGFSARLYMGFPAVAMSPTQHLIRRLRQTAVRWKLVPRTMRGKQFLKRLFYGKLKPIPPTVDDATAPAADLIPRSDSSPVRNFKFLYLLAELPSEPVRNVLRRAA